MNRRHAALVCLAALASAAGLLVAGPLNPPSGPVTSTYKTMTDVEPRTAINAANTPGDSVSIFKIAQPGSYYLTANIQGVSGKSGIDIAVGNVTIDLNGFSITGGTSAGTLAGIRVSPSITSPEDITIQNGTVDRWAGPGVDMETGAPTEVTIRNIRSHNNNAQGIRAGDGTLVLDCESNYNGALGFDTYNNVTLIHCVATGNGGNGIDTLDSNAIIDCSVVNNSGVGVNAHAGCVVSRCTAEGNLRGGVSAASSTVRDSNFLGNLSFGIQAFSQSQILCNNITATSSGAAGNGAGLLIAGSRTRAEGNNCSSNAVGVSTTSAGNFISRNTCSANSTNWSIVAGNKCLVVLGVNGAAVNGDSGGTAPGSTDPNANFTY